MLDDLLALGLELVPIETLARAAIVAGRLLGLSAHDAAYAVLAEAREATLVTADRRLAAVCPGSELVA